jgi:hypothetical protein
VKAAGRGQLGTARCPWLLWGAEPSTGQLWVLLEGTGDASTGLSGQSNRKPLGHLVSGKVTETEAVFSDGDRPVSLAWWTLEFGSLSDPPLPSRCAGQGAAQGGKAARLCPAPNGLAGGHLSLWSPRCGASSSTLQPSPAAHPGHCCALKGTEFSRKDWPVQDRGQFTQLPAMRSRGLNSGPHTCRAGALPLETLHQPSFVMGCF